MKCELSGLVKRETHLFKQLPSQAFMLPISSLVCQINYSQDLLCRAIWILLFLKINVREEDILQTRGNCRRKMPSKTL